MFIYFGGGRVKAKMADGWIGLTEAAAVLGVSRQAVFKMTLDGRLAYQQPNGYGGQIWVLCDDVMARLEADKGARRHSGRKGVAWR